MLRLVELVRFAAASARLAVVQPTDDASNAQAPPRRRIRRALEGSGPLLAVSAGLAALGTIFLVLTLTSIGGLVWIGTPVHGMEQNGIVAYSYHGQSYSIDDTGSYRTGPRTVYIDSSNPSRAVLYTWDSQAIQDSIVAVPYLGAVVFLLVAVRIQWRYTRRRRDRDRHPERRAAFGEGLDPEVIRQILAARQTPPPTRD